MNDPRAPFPDRLRADLAGPLPGRAAQYRMAPRPRPGDDAFEQPRPDTRQGGVLILFYPHGGRPALPLILRPTYTGVHSGQVSLPGGGRLGVYEPRHARPKSLAGPKRKPAGRAPARRKAKVRRPTARSRRR